LRLSRDAIAQIVAAGGYEAINEAVKLNDFAVTVEAERLKRYLDQAA
jgi:hypothetical protein